MGEKVIAEVKMSKAYQITVPSVVRKILKLKPGERMELVERDGNIMIVKAETREEKVKRGFMELERLRVEREKTMTLEQKEFAEMAKGWTINQYHEYIDNLPETKEYLKEKYGVQN